MRQWQPPAGVIKPYRIVFEMGLKNDPARSPKSSFLDRKGGHVIAEKINRIPLFDIDSSTLPFLVEEG